MTIGIYKITNLITNKSYIGLSKHIEQRWQEHKNGKGNKLLYQDFIIYGINNFSFEIIEECPQEQLRQKEEYWINFYNTYKDGYNQNPGGAVAIQAVEKTRKIVYCYDLQGNFIKNIIVYLKLNKKLKFLIVILVKLLVVKELKQEIIYGVMKINLFYHLIKELVIFLKE